MRTRKLNLRARTSLTRLPTSLVRVVEDIKVAEVEVDSREHVARKEAAMSVVDLTGRTNALSGIRQMKERSG